ADHLAFHYGFDALKSMEEEQMTWVIGQHQIKYMRPAVFHETVLIQSCITAVEDRELTVAMKMWDAQQRLKASLLTTFVYCSLISGKSVSIPISESQLFSGLMVDGYK
ncbi:MAG: hypothetical protein EOO04_34155, partial [Chitinophagaceae bacterium]